MRNKMLIRLLLMLILIISCGGGGSGSSPQPSTSPRPAVVINTADYGDGTASQANVAAAIADATYGDTVTIPACAAGDCAWTKGITITKNIKIVGAGADSTYLTVGFTDNSTEEAFFKFVPDETARGNLDSLTEDTANFEVTGIHFYKAAATPLTNKFGVCIYNANTPVIKRVQIYNNAYTNIHRATQVIGYVHGVFHSNTLVNSNASYPQGAGIDAWTSDVRTIGTEQAWYIEDNTFAFPDTRGIISGAANDGGSQVVRYNTMTGTAGCYVEAHSNQGSYIKGGFFTEIYGNNFSGTAAIGIDMRGGKDIIYFNVLNDDSYRVREEFYDAYSGALPDGMSSGSDYSTGNCVGACPQICTDENYCWKVNNSYMFNNRRTATGALQGFAISYDRYDNISGHDNSPAELAENREFFNQNANYNGTTERGIYCGTTLPEACTTGDGAWITSQPCDQVPIASIGANPTSPLSGTLYKCTATNTWTVFYTPYTYPHPLRGRR